MKMRGGRVIFVPHLEPMAEVVADVVAAERQHRHRIAPHHADLAGRGRGGLRTHRRAHEDAMGPVE